MFPYQHSLVSDVAFDDATHCRLVYSPEPERWPWLQLAAEHPVVVQKYIYFTGVSVLLASGGANRDSKTAITAIEWEVPGPGHKLGFPLRADCEAMGQQRRAGFSAQAYAADDTPVLRFSASGVVFRNRDFSAWRSSQRTPRRVSSAAVFAYATAAETGASPPSAVRIGPPDADAQCCPALLRAADGFHPGHPYHTGSGDHVNAAQLSDCVYQAAHALLAARGRWQAGGEPMRCSAGSADFRHYVELEQPFLIRLQRVDEPHDGVLRLQFEVSQGRHSCADLGLTLDSR